MEAALRREKMKQKIMSTPQPITGSELAKVFDVSRQVIVQDVAILRAAGAPILATAQGYMMPGIPLHKSIDRIFACKHITMETLRDELTTIVDLGGRVIDVVVEHPVYGEFRSLLMLSSLSSVRGFIERLEKQGAEPLSSLTGGVHLHTVEADCSVVLDQIEKALLGKGILMKGM